MSGFESFEVQMSIGTPILTSFYPIMLDGLLYYTIAAVHNLDPEGEQDKITQILDTVLAKHPTGVYHASQAIYLRNETQSINSVIVSQASSMGWEDYPHPPQPSKKTIVYKTGRYRNRMTKTNAVTPVGLKFYAHGDYKLCQYYLNQVSGVGRSHHQGHGEVLGVLLSSTPHDLSLTNQDGALNRPLPVEWVEDQGCDTGDCLKEMRAVNPPYLSNRVVEQYSPIQQVQMANII